MMNRYFGKKLFRIICPAILFIQGICACSLNESRHSHREIQCPVRLFAAAGTRLVTDEICRFYEAETGKAVECNYASSGTLARQITMGAPCDLLISANRLWIDYLAERDYIDMGSVRVLAQNSLVVVSPRSSRHPAPDFRGDSAGVVLAGRLAIGDPSYVPVGRYSKMVLDSLGCFADMSGRMVMARDVSSVLRLVEIGECDWGFVYYSEALKSDRISIRADVPGSLHEPIVFYIAAIKGHHSGSADLSRLFLDETGKSIFREQGFRTLDDEV